MNIWLFLLACQPIEEDNTLDPLEFYKEMQDTSSESTVPIDEPETENECLSNLDQNLSDGISEHFTSWLNNSQYNRDFERSDLSGGSFGGFVSDVDCIKKTPIVFVHGNSDRAYGGVYGGFEELTNSLKEQGYRSSELYATTYGSALVQDSPFYSHSQENIAQVRQFIKAVLEYTGSQKVHVISHSLGVTMARKAIMGGVGIDDDGVGYDLGNPLTSSIDAFIGIAGANQGLVNCLGAFTPICSTDNGLYPGSTVTDPSTFLQNINSQSGYEGSRVYSLWSVADEIILYACVVGNQNTCRIPDQDDEKQYYTMGHFQLKNQTGDVIFDMLQNTYVEE